jgi:hypothetical protein
LNRLAFVCRFFILALSAARIRLSLFRSFQGRAEGDLLRQRDQAAGPVHEEANLGTLRFGRGRPIAGLHGIAIAGLCAALAAKRRCRWDGVSIVDPAHTLHLSALLMCAARTI